MLPAKFRSKQMYIYYAYGYCIMCVTYAFLLRHILYVWCWWKQQQHKTTHSFPQKNVRRKQHSHVLNTFNLTSLLPVKQTSKCFLILPSFLISQFLRKNENFTQWTAIKDILFLNEQKKSICDAIKITDVNFANIFLFSKE